MAGTDKESRRDVVFLQYWRDHFSVITKAVVESKHDADLFMRSTSSPEFSPRDNLKMPLEESNMLFE